VASADGLTVALDKVVDDQLLLEGRTLDLIRAVNQARKDNGLELTDRVLLTVPETERDVVEHHCDWIKGEVLAIEIRVGQTLGIRKSPD